MKHILLFLFTLAFQCTYSTSVTAQETATQFTALTSKDGLSSNTVNAIIKDQQGFIWFGTEEGLNRYSGNEFKVYRQDSKGNTGLHSSEITVLFEDSKKTLWVGTAGGSLHYYDRSSDHFVQLSAGPETGQLNSDIIKSIAEDSEGNIWVGTFNGLNILKRSTMQSMRFVSPAYDVSIRSGLVKCIFKDSKNRMWVGTNTALFLYDKHSTSFTKFSHNGLDPNSLSDDMIRTIGEDRKGRIWIGTGDGLCRFDEPDRKFIIYRYNSKDLKSLSNNRIYSFTVADDRHIWIGTDDGLNLMDSESGRFERYGPDQRNSFTLSNKSIRSVYFDDRGITWIGTYEGGVNKLDPHLTLFNLKQSNKYDPYKLSAPLVTAFAQRPDGKIYVGTNGGGLNLYDSKTGIFTRIPIQPGNKVTISNIAILTAIMDRNNRLWMGTYQDGLFSLNISNGSYQQYTKQSTLHSLNNDDIFCLEIDRKGKLWIGSNGGGVSVLDPVTNKITHLNKSAIVDGKPVLPPKAYIRALKEDKDGNMWIGMIGAGIAVFDPKNQTFELYNKRNGSLPSDKITAITQDRKGNMWIGTGGNGLVLLKRKNRTFRTFKETEGLLNGFIQTIIEDNGGKIWVSTNKSISYLDNKTGRFVNFTHYNGLQNNVFVHGAGLKSADGTLFFGGIEGFNYIHPKNLKKNNVPPRLVFTSLIVGDKLIQANDKEIISNDIGVAKEIRLDYKQSLTLNFVALNYTSPEQNLYKYRLLGVDNNWVNGGNKSFATFTHLGPGDYTFEVKASNNNGIWSDKITSIRITVSPPYWRTYYAYFFYLVTGFAIMFFLRHRGIKKLETRFEREQERREALRIHELDEMKIKFLTNLSHEFRTPISLILAPVDRLLSEIDDVRLSRQVLMIKRNTKRLLNLVNHLLDFRKLEEHEIKVNLTTIELVAFLTEICDSFQELAEEKSIDYSFNSDVDSLSADFDADKLERIMFNVLSNAFKFTPKNGAVKCRLRCYTKLNAAQEQWISIVVSDTGIGIPEENLQKIFERFFQDKGSNFILNQGSGIGLSIVREFVELHGGTIGLKSRVGKGSSFEINLPIHSGNEIMPNKKSKRIQNNDQIKDNLQGAGSSGTSYLNQITSGKEKDEIRKKARILIVEDSEEFRRYLSEALKDRYVVMEAANGKEGWQKALSAHPDLIVSDIAMPIMDGIEFIKKVKNDKRTSQIPVILLTASGSESGQLHGLNSGANDYLTKPFNFEILNARINNQLMHNKTLKSTFTRQLTVIPKEIEVEKKSDKLLRNIVQYVEDNLTNPQLSVEDLSRHVGMSRGSLYSKLLELTGKAPVDFIRSTRLEKAASLIEKSDLNIGQISDIVGFSAPNYFSKAFKARFQMMPKEYMILKRKSSGAKNDDDNISA
jgi:signal transduction histidine kinase/ligand-binding sensor domain-containing protein/DNA-binding response OmpR family regulator